MKPLDFALTTNWLSQRHTDGGAMVDEVLALGFDRLEIGYHFQEHLLSGLRRRMTEECVDVGSVHAFSPVPIGVPGGHPELFHLAAVDEDLRRMAFLHTRNTLDFAASLGARVVVVHAGRVPVGGCWTRHAAYCVAGDCSGRVCRWNRRLLLKRRARRIGRHLDALRKSLDELLPLSASAGLVLALENLPSLDALPDDEEMCSLAKSYDTPHLRRWHDIGHGQVMENCGFGNHLEGSRRMLPLTAGVHIHDVAGPLTDHLAPGGGRIDFARFDFLADPSILHVFEPAASVTPDELRTGVEHMRRAWGGG